ncbi:unnamed protein product [Clonostachys rosea]|uniref:F-box domain-containing protein n=1 Tax=Bionectria ochroleuca TaxID=29856 RepID=A0ABY6U1G7_BIOOC|nr:unnamed protein product [Clonostachys rosea]
MLSKIESMAPQVLARIAGHCDSDTFKALTSTSLHMRFQLRDCRHKNVHVEIERYSDLTHTRHILKYLQTRTRTSECIIIGSMTFTINASNKRKRASSEKTPFTDLPLLILDCIGAVRSLRILTLEIQHLDVLQENCFFGLLKGFKIQADNVHVNASPRIMQRVIQNSPQVQALHIFREVNINHHFVFGRNLRGLYLNIRRGQNGYRKEIPTIDGDLLDSLMVQCPCLEELVLYQWLEQRETLTQVEQASGTRNVIDISTFWRFFSKNIRKLQKLPGLRRLAITIDVGVASELGRQWYGEHESSEFYMNCICQIAAHLLQLNEIAIFDAGDFYWHGIKTHYTGMNIKVHSLRKESKGFPTSITLGTTTRAC